MMNFFVLISILFTATAAHPKDCCGAWTYSFTMMSIGGSLSQGSTSAEMYDDIVEINTNFHTEMEHIVSHQLDKTTGKRGNTTIINMYKNQTRYVLREDGTCLKQTFHYVIQPRCTSNYTYAGNYTIGSGTETIAINAWTIQYPNPNALTQVILTDDGECTPVSQTVYGLSKDGKSQFMSAMIYTNFKTNVQNSNKFILPAACTNPMVIPVGKRALEEATGKEYRFLY